MFASKERTKVIWVLDAHFTLSLSYLKKRIATFKEKASVTEVDLFANSKGQTQNCIFEAQIYSFLFQHFVKSFQKNRKSLEKGGLT